MTAALIIWIEIWQQQPADHTLTMLNGIHGTYYEKIYLCDLKHIIVLSRRVRSSACHDQYWDKSPFSLLLLLWHYAIFLLAPLNKGCHTNSLSLEASDTRCHLLQQYLLAKLEHSQSKIGCRFFQFLLLPFSPTRIGLGIQLSPYRMYFLASSKKHMILSRFPCLNLKL